LFHILNRDQITFLDDLQDLVPGSDSDLAFNLLRITACIEPPSSTVICSGPRRAVKVAASLVRRSPREQENRHADASTRPRCASVVASSGTQGFDCHL